MQAIRVVTRLENRYAEHDGLNLTWETLEGILKHNGPLVDRDGRPVGRYVEEGLPAGLDDIPASADLQLSTHASLEAQAAAIADDIAYNAHDIDDALRAGLIALADLADVPLVGPIVARGARAAGPTSSRSRQAHEVQRRLITRAIEDVIADAPAPPSPRPPRRAPTTCATPGGRWSRFSAATAEAEQGLKRFLFDDVYRNEAVMVPVRAQPGAWSASCSTTTSSTARPARSLGRAPPGAADRPGRSRPHRLPTSSPA